MISTAPRNLVPRRNTAGSPLAEGCGLPGKSSRIAGWQHPPNLNAFKNFVGDTAGGKPPCESVNLARSHKAARSHRLIIGLNLKAGSTPASSNFLLALQSLRCKFQSFGRQPENWRWLLSPERKPTLWLFSYVMPQGSQRHHRRFSELNGLYLARRIGSVIREQRPARATTRTTGCSLNGVGNRPDKCLHCLVEDGHAVTPHHSEIIRWSSRPRPVNRLQATGQPRRVMRGGSKSCALGSKEQDGPVPAATQGKLSLSPKNRGKEQTDNMPISSYKDFLASVFWADIRERKKTQVTVSIY